jgi:hypothetical protein
MTELHQQQMPDPEPGWEKLCRECEGIMSVKDRHARCQKCRKAGGYKRYA